MRSSRQLKLAIWLESGWGPRSHHNTNLPEVIIKGHVQNRVHARLQSLQYRK